MNKKCFLLIIVTLFVMGCHSTISKKPPINDPSDDATIKLAEAAASISNTLDEVARVEKVIKPPLKNNKLTIPDAYSLHSRASVDWSGPIEELAARVANAAHYQFHVLGKRPSIPILISITAEDESLTELLRDIDYQAGIRADIYVFPNRQMVELRYAKFYS